MAKGDPWDLIAQWHWLQAVLADPKLSGAAKSTAGRLADHANDVTGHAWPSEARMARNLGITDRSVRSGLAQLVAGGYVSRVSRATGPGMTCTWALKRQHRKESSAVTADDTENAIEADEIAENDTKRRKEITEHRKESSENTGKNLPPNLPNELTHEPAQELCRKKKNSEKVARQGDSASQDIERTAQQRANACARLYADIGSLTPEQRTELYENSTEQDERAGIDAESKSAGSGLAALVNAMEQRTKNIA